MTSSAPQTNEDRSTILVFSHDLHDARFCKRLRILSDLGFSVRWLASDRERKTNLNSDILRHLPGAVLGKSRDADYLGRVATIVSAVVKLLRKRLLPDNVKTIYSINLDNLLIAILAKTIRRMECRIVYEVADIQPILLRKDKVGQALRAVERWCLKRTDLVIYTSEKFMSEFLRSEQGCQAPSLLLENKIYPATNLPRNTARMRAKDERITIGLCGQLRCRKTMEMIRELAAAFPEKIRFVLRGYPNHEARNDFETLLADAPNVIYGGPYRYPEDLADVYGSVDLCWGFDFCSPGRNSKWCLTNRLYEAGYFGVPILVEDETAGGEYVRRLGSGWVFPQPLDDSLKAFFSRVNVEEVSERQVHTARLDASAFVLDSDLAGLRNRFSELVS